MTLYPLEPLLAPLSENDPCGPDLVYDAEFIALEIAAQGTPERQAGASILAPVPPNWGDVFDAALTLARRTRDLRVAMLLTRAGGRTKGAAGYASGITLLAGLMAQHWEGVHPRLEGDDATMRLFALAALYEDDAGLADLRACAIGVPAKALTVRLIELAWGKCEPLPGEVRPTPAGITEGLREAAASDATVVESLAAIHAAAANIQRITQQHCGIAGPDMTPLLRITAALDQAVKAVRGEVSAPAAQHASVGTHAGKTATAGAIESRDDVVRTLDAVCDWIARHEPTNPAPLLIRRAQRLMSKSFIDLVRDLAPEGLSQIERIAGVTES